MFKRIHVIIALIVALIFGGAFSASAQAGTADQQHQTFKVYYSMNGKWGHNSWLSNYLNRMLGQWNTGKHDQPKQEESKKAEPKQEKPKQEKPKQEEPKQEQPKPEASQPVQETQTNQPAQNEQKNQGQSYQLNQFEQQVVELTNNERAKHGLSALQADWELSRVAREKSRDMATVNYFDHNSPTYGSPFDMMKSYGISYRGAGENIAKGQRSPQEVVNAWMNSPGHRANILNGDFTHIGVGFVEQGNHWTQMFISR